MVTSSVHSYSTTLKRGANTIAEVSSITGPKPSRNAIDVTHLNSPDTYKEFIAGMKDGGEVSIEANFYPGDTNGQIGLRDDFEAGTIQDFTVTFPTSTGTTWTFKGLVTEFGTDAPLDDKLPFSATIKITAKPAMGVTASANITAFVMTEPVGGAVAGVPTPFAAATYEYSYVVLTASTYVTINVTQATATLITVYNDVNGVTQTLLTTVESGQLVLGAADTISRLVVTVKDALKSPTVYTFHVVRP